jgi:hypothetical protein
MALIAAAITGVVSIGMGISGAISSEYDRDFQRSESRRAERLNIAFADKENKRLDDQFNREMGFKNRSIAQESSLKSRSLSQELQMHKDNLKLKSKGLALEEKAVNSNVAKTKFDSTLANLNRLNSLFYANRENMSKLSDMYRKRKGALG